MSETVEFKSDFIKITKELVQNGSSNLSVEERITFELNLLLSMISVPVENTKFKKRNAERRFFEPCVNFLKENAEIEIGADKKDRFIMMDLRDAIAHLHIECEKENDDITAVILRNEFHNETNFLCRITVENLKSFVLLLADEYEIYCDKINLLSNR